jgi:hypothetical protein
MFDCITHGWEVKRKVRLIKAKGNTKIRANKVLFTGGGWRVAGGRLQVAGYKLQVASCRLHATGYRMIYWKL